MQQRVEDVHVDGAVGLYIVDVVAATRDSARIQVGASPRGSLALYKLAALPGRAARPRLRPARRRQGGRRPRARPPAHAQARALGAPRAARGDRRARSSRPSPTPAAEDRVPRPNDALGLCAAGGIRGVRVGDVPGGAFPGPARPWPRSGAPFAAFLVLALTLARAPEPRPWRSRSPRSRTVEGEQVDARLELTTDGAVHEVELALCCLRTASSSPTAPSGSSCGSRPASGASCRSSSCRGAGARSGSATIAVRVRDRFGLVAHDAVRRGHVHAARLSAAERLRSLVSPLETQPFAGNRVARVRGEGIEFADLRPFVPGDRVRRVNWRVSARRGELYVNEHHPERNSDVVLFLDSFAEVRREREGTLDQAVRAAASLRTSTSSGATGSARRLRRRRAVAAAGNRPAQDYRIADALITSEVTLSYARRTSTCCRRGRCRRRRSSSRSPAARRAQHAGAADLRGRGFDLAVVDVSPLPFVTPPLRLSRTRSPCGSGRCGASRCVSTTSASACRSSSGRRASRSPGDRGGELIPSLRASRLRLAVGGSASCSGPPRPCRRSPAPTESVPALVPLALFSLVALAISLLWRPVPGILLAGLAVELVVREARRAPLPRGRSWPSRRASCCSAS